jgi:hypothetical protein
MPVLPRNSAGRRYTSDPWTCASIRLGVNGMADLLLSAHANAATVF